MRFLFIMLASFCFSQNLTNFITIDQFGYRESTKKTAVIRVPQKGFGSPCTYAPGTNFQVINEASGATVFSGVPTAFSGGQIDTASGDKIWHFITPRHAFDLRDRPQQADYGRG